MSEQFVPKYYVMDPGTEEFVFDGKSLADGMEVLIADPNERERHEGADSDWKIDRLLERNRWCTVSKVTVLSEINSIHFLATYEDGTQRKRCHSITQGWLVKKDSIAASLDVTTERYMNVYSVVKEALKKQSEVAFHGNFSDLDEILETATKQILGLL